ncbi:MAG: RNA polymerase sigma factor [Armatimonadota bacterium]
MMKNYGYEYNIPPFEELFRNHHNSIKKRISKYVDNADDVDDLCQEVYCRALNAYPHFRGECDPKTWLITIANNIRTDYLKRKDKQIKIISLDEPISNDNSITLKDELAAQPAIGVDPVTTFEHQELLEIFQEELRYLSAKEQFLFRAWAGKEGTRDMNETIEIAQVYQGFCHMEVALHGKRGRIDGREWYELTEDEKEGKVNSIKEKALRSIKKLHERIQMKYGFSLFISLLFRLFGMS